MIKNEACRVGRRTKTNGILRSRVCAELHEGRKLSKAVCRVNNIPSLRSSQHGPLSIRVEISARVWQLSNCLRLSSVQFLSRESTILFFSLCIQNSKCIFVRSIITPFWEVQTRSSMRWFSSIFLLKYT